MTTDKMHNWKPRIGQTVYLRPHDRREAPRTETVNKVGRKYFYVGPRSLKFDIETKQHVNEPYFGRYICYISEEAYKALIQAQEERQFVKDNLKYLDDEQISELYRLIVEIRQSKNS